MRHLLTLADLTAAEIERIFSIAEDLQKKSEQGLREPLLAGRVMALLFEKPSLRTRVSFEAGMAHLGGSSIFLSDDAGFGHRESVPDFARVLGQYADVIVIRAYRHQTALDLATHSGCAVINGLTDFGHPCQALADLYTVRQLAGKFAGNTLAWIGDANNVARSVAVGCGKLGLRLVMATPKKYQFSLESLAWIKQQAPKLDLSITTDPVEAVRDAVAVYTDVWASMGQEEEAAERRKIFMPFQVNQKLFSKAAKHAVFMHCLPAHRGDEVTAAVIDSPRSVVFDQAENRLHIQKAIMVLLLEGGVHRFPPRSAHA